MIPRIPEQLLDKLDILSEKVLDGRVSKEASVKLSAELWNAIFKEFLYNTEMGEKILTAIPGNVGRRFFVLTESEGTPIIFEFLPYPDIIRARIAENSEIEDLPGILISDTETRIRFVTGRVDLIQALLRKKIRFRKTDELTRMGSGPLTFLLSIFNNEDAVREKLVNLLPTFEEIFKRYGI